MRGLFLATAQADAIDGIIEPGSPDGSTIFDKICRQGGDPPTGVTVIGQTPALGAASTGWESVQIATFAGQQQRSPTAPPWPFISIHPPRRPITGTTLNSVDILSTFDPTPVSPGRRRLTPSRSPSVET